MRLKLFFFTIAFFVVCGTSYGQILTFDFVGLVGNEVTATSNTKNANLTNSTISRGAGLTASLNGDRYNATDWATTSIANAVSGNDYMEFTITPTSGFQFSVSSIVIQWQRSATGSTAIALRSSVDGYAANLDAEKAVVDNTTTQTVTFTFAQANSTNAVTYRLYSYAEALTGSGGPGDGTGNDIIVNGSVTASSPTINGTITAGEYGTHTDGNNQQTSGASATYMTWDTTNLYIAVNAANTNEGFVLYLDKDPQALVNGGTNANGTNVGLNYDGTSFAELPYRADLVLYVKNGYREYRTADGSNSWSGATTSFGSYADNGSTIREFSIPWSAIGGMPASFNHFSYVTSPGGSVYAQTPTENANGSIGTSARFSRYYTVSTTTIGSATPPFSRNSFVFNSASDVTSFGAISAYDFTMNSSGRILSRTGSTAGNWAIAGNLTVGVGTVYLGSGGGTYGTTTVTGNLNLLGGTFDMDQTTAAVSVTGNVAIASGAILKLSGTASGDLNLAGNWTNSGTFTPNGRAVTFNGTGNQTITNATGETFNYLINNKASGTLTLANNVTVNGSTGSVLQLLNAGGFDLNGKSLTLSGAGGDIQVTGGARTITSSTAASINITGDKTVSGSGTLILGTNLTTLVGAVIDFGSSKTTINGILQINSGYVSTNSPIYGNASTLKYNFNGTFGRTYEWFASGVGTINVTPGYPNNVQLSNNTTLNYLNTTSNAVVGVKAMAGNLTVDSGSTLNMDFNTSPRISSGGALVVAGSLSNAGTLTLGFANGDDLKVGGDFTNTGTFNGNNRAVFFIRSTTGTQLITASAGITIPYIVIQPAAGTDTVQLATGTNLTISAPLTGIALTFTNATDILDINSNTLTIGTSTIANTITGPGTFKGSTASNLTLLGTGSSIGTLKFANDLNLRILTIDRTSGVIGATLASALTINNSLVLNNGLLDLAGFNLTMAAAPSGTITSSTTNFIIADGSGELRKIFTANSSFTFPIGDNTTGLEYSPATINFANPAATYGANSYVGMKVRDAQEPNNEAPTDFITRYWNLTSANITNATYNFTGTYLPADISGIETNYKSGRLRTSNLTWLEGTNSGANTVSFTGLLSSAAALDSSGGYNFTAGNPFKRAEINIQDATPTTYLSGSEYNFGTVSIGDYVEVVFTIKNSGLENLTLDTATLTGTGYSLQTSYTSPVVPAGSTTFTIRFTPITAGTLTGSISIPNNDTTGSENPYIINFKGIGACLKVDFEGAGAVKTSYPSAEVEDINGKAWLLTEALIGDLAADYKIGLKSLRMRSNANAIAEMLEDQTLGINVVTFNYKLFSGDASAATFKVEYSKDSGNSWFQLGPTFTPTTSVQIFNQTLNQSGPVRIRIKYDSGIVNDDLRMNIDNIESCSYLNAQEIEVFGNLTTIQNGSTPKLSNLTKFTDFFLLDPTIINTYTVTNTGTGTLTLTDPTYTGSSDFIISPLSSTSLVAGASATFTISFTSIVGGLKTGTVSIGNNDSDESPFTFNITAFVKSYVRCALEAVAVIAQQDFESSPATPILDFTSLNGTFTSTGGNAYGSNRTSTSPKFIGARSYQVTGAGGTNTLTSTSSLNLSSYKNIVMSFNIGGYSVNTTNGLDTSDEVRVSISTDGGTTWKEQLFIRGNSNSIFDINSATGSPINVVYDATLTTGLTFGSKSSSMNTFSRTFTISSLPNSTQLKVKFTIIANNSNEVWAIDNVKLEGQLPKSTTWNGTAWSSGVPPTSSTKAIFDGNYTTSSTTPSVKACECLINATGTITVSADDYIEIQSDLTNYGTLIIENDGSLVQVNDDAVNTGIIRYERTTPDIFRTDYTYWSSPVAGYTLGGVSQNLTLWDKYYSYDPTIVDWKQESSATVMSAGIGYIIRGDETEPFQNPFDAFFIGVPNNGVYSITNVIADKSYLLGNPYASALDADTFLVANKNVLNGTLYFWTHNTPMQDRNLILSTAGSGAFAYTSNDYATYNATGGVGAAPPDSGATTGSAPSGGTGGINNNIPNGKIASGQGFFASSIISATSLGNITFNNSMRVDNSGNIMDNSQFFKTKNTKEKEANKIEKHRIWLNLTNTQGAFKQTLVGYITDATNEYDSRFDGESFDAHEFVDFYSVSQEKNLVIQGRALPFNENDEVPLGFRTTIAGPFTINIDQVDGALTNQSVFIEDKLTNTVFDLKTANYTFNTVAGTFNDRFVLRYTNKTLSNNDFDSLENQVLVSNKNKQIKVNVTTETIDKVIVYDLLGRQLFKKDKVDSNELTIPNLVSSQQTLLVKVSLQNGQTVTKKIIY